MNELTLLLSGKSKFINTGAKICKVFIIGYNFVEYYTVAAGPLYTSKLNFKNRIIKEYGVSFQTIYDLRRCLF